MNGEFDAGDVVWMTLEPGAGREQRGRRPVLVVTDQRLAAVRLAWVVPLSTTDRGWPIHVTVTVGGRTSYAMCEQLRAVPVDRLGQSLGRVSYDNLVNVRAILHSLAGQ